MASPAKQTLIIPRPLEVKAAPGGFTLSRDTLLLADEPLKKSGNYLKGLLAGLTGIDFRLETVPAKREEENAILLVLDPSLAGELGAEGYLLESAEPRISISAPAEAGIFYGIQSLRQTLPETLESGNGKPDPLRVPGLEIKDKPRFSWRAFMLDEARHFKGAEVVKRLLDEMALLKMNVFHWHLSDDQGWRIEIKKYPRLTEIGARRRDTEVGGNRSGKRSGRPHAGHYTQEQIKEIVAYAAERHITVVPEIDLPGHTGSAIAAYPWLGTSDESIEVPVIFGVLPYCLNLAEPRVSTFVEEVLQELMELFPSQVIHIGGDEVKYDHWKGSARIRGLMEEQGLKTPADLQLWFTNRLSLFLEAKGRRMMGWNEILGEKIHHYTAQEESGSSQTLARSAIVHFWAGTPEMLRRAASKGYNVVNSYCLYTYLDYDYRRIPLRKAYDFDPLPRELEAEYHRHILGTGCQMWSEWIPQEEEMYRQVFPRLPAYAEGGWTEPDRKDYALFRNKLAWLCGRWDYLGIPYTPLDLAAGPET